MFVHFCRLLDDPPCFFDFPTLSIEKTKTLTGLISNIRIELFVLFSTNVCIGEPAKSYPFTLDPFQSQAILCIENNQSVLVSAHTSAGKTVTAEYAISLSLKLKQR